MKLIRPNLVIYNLLVGLVSLHVAAGPTESPKCEVVRKNGKVELRAPGLIFHLDTTRGLRADSFENRLTGRKISLGLGPELDVDIGPLGGALEQPNWRITQSPAAKRGSNGEAIFDLVADKPALSARVTYRWNATEPVLRKFIEITNRGEREVMLLNVRLGTYRTQARLRDREQGFPVYLNDEFFMSVAHPAGWATATNSEVSLRQYPGTKLSPGGKFTAMETVYGVGAAGEARTSFVAHVRSRMRRVVRKHDKPYAIFDNFGSWSLKVDGFEKNTEANVLYSLERVAESQRAEGVHFDICNLHFWVDHAGDLIRFDPQRFPNGITNIKKLLDAMGTAPGLWIDSAMAAWSLANNPDVKNCLTEDPAHFCRASEPIKSMYEKAFRHHIRVNGVRELKFDNLRTTCNNPKHSHLPGLYSTEAIPNSVIEFLHALDEENPDVFLILYWGHRSPWWLLHGDTLFDSGLGIEAASPSTQPSPYARDSITQKLDQAQRHSSDVPALGKDSLGVWLSDWWWNSSVGKERWQEGFVMDICRGSLLAQLWADREWLSLPEWRDLADLLALLRAQPRCFENPRFILGDASKDEPYGYCCTDGKRAFLALNNCTWMDNSLTLKLNSAWGLPNGKKWDLYRCYPNPARLTGNAPTFGEATAVVLRPFEVVLLEVVPAGQKPSFRRALATEPIPNKFTEASQSVKLNVEHIRPEREAEAEALWTVLRPNEARSAAGATLTIQPDGSVLASGHNPSTDTYTITAKTDLNGITGVRLEALPDPGLPSSGPGRVFNGNFALNEFQVTAAPQSNGSASAPVELCNPVADYFQASHGGWPISAAIDGDPKTGWSIDPEEGLRHVAQFELKKAIGFEGGTTLTFTLQHGENQHTLGKFRLSVTRAKPPFPKPPSATSRTFVVRGESPDTSQGGLVVVTLQLRRNGELVHMGSIGSYFTSEGKIAGQNAKWQPVLGRETYPSSWQAWRLIVPPSSKPQPFELSITTKAPVSGSSAFAAHFLPASGAN